jgi:hypothetical protein
LELAGAFCRIGSCMSGEVSYFSRFFVKFIEIIAAGLASAISAYLLAHFGGLLSSPTPASAPAPTAVQVGPIDVAKSAHAQPLAATNAANEQHPAPQHDTDASVAQPAPRAAKDAKPSPLRKQVKTDTSVAEKEPLGQKSVEALTRAALAHVDANRPAPADALIGADVSNTRSAPVDTPQVPPRQSDVGPQPVEGSPSSAANTAAHPEIQPQQVQPRPAIGTDVQPPSPDRPMPAVDVQTRPVAGVNPLSPSPALEIETAGPQPRVRTDRDNGVFSTLQQIPDLLRPEPPPVTDEIPRPPMPVGTVPPE